MKLVRIALLLLIAALLTIPTVSCTMRNSPSKMIHVNGRYALNDGGDARNSSDYTVYVTNEDTFDWHNVMLAVQDLYKYPGTIDVIKSGETFSRPLSDFMLNGKPFDITAFKPAKIQVRSSEGTFYGPWTKE